MSGGEPNNRPDDDEYVPSYDRPRPGPSSNRINEADSQNTNGTAYQTPGDATYQAADGETPLVTEQRRRNRKPVFSGFVEGLRRRAAAYKATKQILIEPDTNHSRPCIIIGPSGSGKTFLLLAIGRACFQPRRDNLRLSFVPDAPKSDDALSITKLMNRSVKIITGRDKDRFGSREPSDISFEITAEGIFPDKWGKKKILSAALNMTVSDGPGGALFVDEENPNASAPEILRWQTHLISKAREAKSLIFCIDTIDPNTPLLNENLPELIGKMIHDVSLKVTPNRGPWGQMADVIMDRQPEIYEKTIKRLNFDRFLILLNKVDRLCAGSKTKRPDQLAAEIDPVGHAKHALGVELLNQITQALKPGAKFAIGVTSALGFHPVSGLPLANKDGFVPPGAATPSEILNIWEPFGVRDALFFIATGHATGRVRLVNPEVLLKR